MRILKLFVEAVARRRIFNAVGSFRWGRGGTRHSYLSFPAGDPLQQLNHTTRQTDHLENGRSEPADGSGEGTMWTVSSGSTIGEGPRPCMRSPPTPVRPHLTKRFATIPLTEKSGGFDRTEDDLQFEDDLYSAGWRRWCRRGSYNGSLTCSERGFWAIARISSTRCSKQTSNEAINGHQGARCKPTGDPPGN
ncbi:hypothetical protein B296_00025703 [Ensete ventricosum]|uniref:Uncharacterized protein n=1 Tax=Ensete ventricosum TaxID=4639 RepID=A0A427A4R8_ENSVE|nr:hypothetical protein B296_00025703 [Ensete ventricosum]